MRAMEQLRILLSTELLVEAVVSRLAGWLLAMTDSCTHVGPVQGSLAQDAAVECSPIWLPSPAPLRRRLESALAKGDSSQFCTAC